ncbi:hypothetical protein SRHO_G00339070 [Serrasalmus rhombeus]
MRMCFSEESARSCATRLARQRMQCAAAVASPAMWDARPPPSSPYHHPSFAQPRSPPLRLSSSLPSQPLPSPMLHAGFPTRSQPSPARLSSRGTRQRFNLFCNNGPGRSS